MQNGTMRDIKKIKTSFHSPLSLTKLNTKTLWTIFFTVFKKMSHIVAVQWVKLTPVRLTSHKGTSWSPGCYKYDPALC